MATPLVKNVPASPKSPVLQPLIYKSVVTIYRIFAIVTLYVVLGGVLAYGFVMGFYALNTSWARCQPNRQRQNHHNLNCVKRILAVSVYPSYDRSIHR